MCPSGSGRSAARVRGLSCSCSVACACWGGLGGATRQGARSARTAGHLSLVLGGNCRIAVGTLNGLTPDRRAIFWFDAHGGGNLPAGNCACRLDRALFRGAPGLPGAGVGWRSHFYFPLDLLAYATSPGSPGQTKFSKRKGGANSPLPPPSGFHPPYNRHRHPNSAITTTTPASPPPAPSGSAAASWPSARRTRPWWVENPPYIRAPSR